MTDTAWPNSTRISCRVVAIVESGGGGAIAWTNAITARAGAALDAAHQAAQLAAADLGVLEHRLHGCVVIGGGKEGHGQTVLYGDISVYRTVFRVSSRVQKCYLR
ncbi:hypothetical protein [Burkholderia sp. MS455]|uniref:hypothetical protein n=1 Tax=Burkholderia sp. MS455 TaxID=2811788 RepID=UPI00195D60E8|nr:hypothetical protein [Burkholderia sp. MS455]